METPTLKRLLGAQFGSMQALSIDHVNLAFPADRLEEVIEFYVTKLGFDSPFEDPFTAVTNNPGLFGLTLGPTCRLFVNPTASFDEPANNFRHVAVALDTTPAALHEHLAAEDIMIQHEAERNNDALGAYTSYYVSDPFGYTIELMACDKADE